MDPLQTLTEQARTAATAYTTLDRETTETKRARVLDYGRALAGIRKLIPSKQAFARHLHDHGLAIYDAPFRSNAIWIADHWDDLVKKLSHCPESNPTNIRHWIRKMNRPKPTRVGQGDPARTARTAVRAKLTSGEPLVVKDLVQQTGHSRIIVEAAIAAEQGVDEGLRNAPLDVVEAARALGLGKRAIASLEALRRRLAGEFATRLQDGITAGIRKHVQEYVLPEYESKLTEIDRRIERRAPALTPAEYKMLMWALHEDQTSPLRRADAFAMVRRLKILLGGAEKGELKPRHMPLTLDELMRRREEVRRENSARAKNRGKGEIAPAH
jgi:hypothetical protein